MSETLNKDIEDFTRGLAVSIYDLNKKHNDVLYRTNLGNHMVGIFRFMNKLKEDREENEQNKPHND